MKKVFAVLMILLGAGTAHASFMSSDLYQAIRHGKVDDVRRVIAAGADVQLRTENGDTYLFYKMYHIDHDYGDELTSILVNAGIDVNAVNRDGCSALMAANTPVQVRELLRAGARVNQRDNQGRTALFYHTNPDIIKMLLDAGVDPESRDNASNTALIAHAGQRPGSWDGEYDPDGSLLVLERAADINAKNNYGETALSAALNRSNIPLAKALIARNASLSVRDANGTPLLIKGLLSRSEIVNALLESGFDLRLTDASGNTLLHYAVMAGNTGLVRSLLEKGVDVNRRNTAGITAYMIAHYSGRSELKELLAKANADTGCALPAAKRSWTMADPDGRTMSFASAREFAAYCVIEAFRARRVDVEFVREALDAGITPGEIQVADGPYSVESVVLYTGDSALIKLFMARGYLQEAIRKRPQMLAESLSNCDDELVIFMLRQGMSPQWLNMYNNSDETESRHLQCLDRVYIKAREYSEIGNLDNYELCHAAYKGDLARMKQLIKVGADPCYSTVLLFRRTSALIAATRAGQIDAARLLLERGADPQQVPVELVCASPEMIELFQQAGMKSELVSLPMLERDKDDNSMLMLKSTHGINVAQKYNSWVLGYATRFTPLMVAVRQGEMPITRTVLAQPGVDVNVHEPQDGYTALMVAAARDKPELCALLLERGAEINAITHEGITPLMVAIANNAPDAARLLLDRGADVNQTDADGWTALHHACEQGRSEIVELLLSKKPLLQVAANDGLNIYGLCLAQGHVALAQRLSELGAPGLESLQARQAYNKYRLLQAAATGSDDQARVLLQQGVNPNVPDWFGRSPLFLAAMNGHAGCAARLIAAGANVSSRADDGTTPFLAAANNHAAFDILYDWQEWRSGDMYNSSGLDYDDAEKELFKIASRVRVLDLLSQNGARVDEADNEGRTALMIAVNEHCLPLVEYLLGKGANPRVRDNLGLDALMHVSRLSEKTLAMLGRAGVEINGSTPDGITPLMLAAWCDNDLAVQDLLKAGANPALYCRCGFDALDYALMNNSKRCAALLR